MANHPLVVNIRTERCDVFVGRPSKWGNPFKLGYHGDRNNVLSLYREWLEAKVGTRDDLIAQAKLELRGKKLGCYCAPLDCHASILAEIANGE